MATQRHSGFTLVELVVAITIIGVGLTAVLSAFNLNVAQSANPLIRKQMFSVAEGMMSEIVLRPFQANGAAPGNVPRNCGPAAARAGFDDVRDFNGYATTGICDADGVAVAGLADYNLAVTVVNDATLPGVPAADVLRIDVTVNRGGEAFTLQSWRVNYVN